MRVRVRVRVRVTHFHNPAWSIYQVSNIMALTAILARVRVSVT